MDAANTNSAIEGYLERISSQLDSILHNVSSKKTDSD